MLRRQRLIVESLTRTQEEQRMMDELQRMIVEKLRSTEGQASIHIIWENEGQEERPLSSHAASGTNPIGNAVPLSIRQREIASLVCSHYSVRKIATTLHISENTVKKHIQNIKRVLEITESGPDFVYELQIKLGSIIPLDN
ncbi:LuxR family transcriptional regulator [Paenibacillus zeisoli]|uniref:LuxR family transcriptional regulator n=1 Tax=Paenibacillus zeisoli TaxID=2496267 RepID=A0A3S1B979_9BACL|nr:helix-turn-helix transcriptional regulator [Paenibacillus zeisoli]RUT35895.1 LuxR family transcriptional regulator [Paenibacillus zeisoli]